MADRADPVEQVLPAATVSALRASSRWAGAALAALGLAVLFGWMAGSSALRSVAPDLAPMKPNTAVCFVLFGLALWIDGAITHKARAYLRLATAAVLAIALLTLAEHASHITLGLDQLLLRQPWSSPFPRRMSTATATCFALLAAALLTLDTERTRLPRAPHVWLAIAVMLCSFLELLGYLYDVRSLYVIGSFNTTALHTAAGLLVASLALLCARPRRGPLRIVISASPGGVLARRMLPAVLLVPLVLGWLRVRGQQANLYGTGFGTAMFAAANMGCLSALLLWTARALLVADSARRQASARLHESEMNLTLTLNSIADGVVATDLGGRITRMNPIAASLSGWPLSEATGRPFSEVFLISREDEQEPTEDPVALVLREGTSVNLASHTMLLARDGQEHPVSTNGSPIRDAAGALRGVVLTFRDQTAERQVHALRESQARRAALLEPTRDGGMTDNDGGHITELNATASASLKTARETVLLTEDDEQLRVLLATILRRNGYKVLEAATGDDALTMCQQYRSAIDVLLTDVVMPRMSGRQLWDHVTHLRPSMKVLFMSGYGDDALLHHGVSASEFALVHKPILPTPLLLKLRSLLDHTDPDLNGP